jgi:hypothetical protein
MVWFINIYVGWVLALTKIPLHMVTSHELRPALTINCNMIPKILEWFQAKQKKRKSVLDKQIKRGTITVFTPKLTLKPWARFPPILNMACSVPDDAEYTSTLQAQKFQDSTGGTRKRMSKDKGYRVQKKKKKQQQRILEDSENSDDTYNSPSDA